MAVRTDRPFVDEVPRLLRARGWSIRELARRAGVTDAHLSRVLRGVDYKTPSAELASRVAVAFGLPKAYFPEFREAFVLDHVRADPALREELYTRLQRRRLGGTKRRRTSPRGADPGKSQEED